MPTMLPSGTRSVSVAAPPTDVVGFLGEFDNLARWAPDFAASVRPQDVVITADAQRGTVDITAAREGRPGGAYLRVLPNADGAEVVFTIVFGAPVDEAAIAAQLAVIEGELRTVRELCER